MAKLNSGKCTVLLWQSIGYRHNFDLEKVSRRLRRKKTADSRRWLPPFKLSDKAKGDLARGDFARGDFARGDLVRGDLVRGEKDYNGIDKIEQKLTF